MSYSLLSPQPGPRDQSLAYDDVGPGLYPDESAFVLADGSSVAVSVVPKWLENGAGVAFTSYARLINADGSTILTADGQHIETSFSSTFDVNYVKTHGLNTLARELIYVLLNEPPTTHVVGGETVPIVDVSDELRANADIQGNAALAVMIGPEAIDAAQVMGL